MEKVNLSGALLLVKLDEKAKFVEIAKNGFFTNKAWNGKGGVPKAMKEKITTWLSEAKIPLVVSDEFAGGFGGASNRPLFDAVGVVEFTQNGKTEKVETKVLVDRMYAIADFLTELAEKRGITAGKGELLNVQIALKADGGKPEKK